MKKHFNYLKGLLKHKYWVFVYCLKLKVPLYLAIFHDISKFSFIEWFPYVNNFYNNDGTKRSVRNSDGSYDPNKQSDKFKLAWINHQRNKHHWQAWVNVGDNGLVTPIDIPEKYIREMIADWCGAGMSYSGKATPVEWYNSNKDKMILSEYSKLIIKNILEDFIP